MKRSGWLTFSAVVLIITGIMRVIDAIWAFGYHGSIPNGLRGALFGHSLTTYGWIWLIIGIILVAAGVLVLGPSDQPAAEISRWVGIVAASLAAISARSWLVSSAPPAAAPEKAMAPVVVLPCAIDLGGLAAAGSFRND